MARMLADIRRYAEHAASESLLLICGRLGEYRCYDRDQAIGRAMKPAERILMSEIVDASLTGSYS